jgi:hypothetical protein
MRNAIAWLFPVQRGLDWQFLLATLGALFVAFTLSIGYVIPAVAAVAAVYLVACYGGMAVAPDSGRRDAVFWLMITLLFAIPFAHKVLGGGGYGVRVDGLMELFLIGALILAVPSAIRWFRESAYGLAVLFLLLVFLAWSLLSSVFGQSPWLAGTYQFLTNAKFFCMLMVGFYVAWTGRTERAFWGLVRWLWFALALFVLWQYLSPGSYTALISHYSEPALHDHFLHLPGRAQGPFHQSSIFAYVTALFMLFALAKGLVEERRGYFVIASLYFLLLVASGQRQELASAPLAAILIISVAKGKRYALPIFALGVVVVALAAIWLAGHPYIQHIAENWGISGHAEITEPRPAMYIYSVDVAQKYAPLGSGLGTFGGAGAQKFNLSFYVDLGFRNYSWFGVSNFLVDTLWPNLVAETGWIGATLMLLIMVALGLYALIESLKPRPPPLRLYWLMALAGQAFPFLISPTSAAYQNVELFFWGAIFFGIAYNATRRSESAASAGASPGPVPVAR